MRRICLVRGGLALRLLVLRAKLRKRSSCASVPNGARRLVEPKGCPLVPPVQPQDASEIVDSLFIPAETEENAAADQVKPHSTRRGVSQFSQGKTEAPACNES